MPIRKPRLSPAEERKYAKVAQQLREVGIAVDIPEDWTRQNQEVDILVGALSRIYVLRPGVTIYAVYTQLTSRCNNLIMEDWDLECAWEEGILLCSTTAGAYRFGSVQFDLDEVLNHKLEKPFRFSHVGDRLEGWLLGQGIRPVPAEYANGRRAPFVLRFLDASGETHDAEASATVIRTGHYRQVRARPTSLFDRQPSSTVPRGVNVNTSPQAPKDQARARVNMPTPGLRRQPRSGVETDSSLGNRDRIM